MNREFEIKDEKLREVVNKHSSKFENFGKHLEKSSNDIRGLEGWLEKSNVCIPCWIRLPSSHDFLGWDKIDGVWRLGCQFLDENDIIHLHDHEFEEVLDNTASHYWNTRPLIEMPVKERLEYAVYLPNLVEQLSNILPDLPDLEPGKTKNQLLLSL